MSRRWCFTVNNPSEDECIKIHDLVSESVYLVAGDERGASGTPHLQGYVVFPAPWRLNRVKAYMPRAHLEVARGTSDENRKYCMKDGKYEEYGECPADARITSERNHEEWDSAFELAKVGEFEAIPKHMLIRYYASFQKIHRDYQLEPECLDQLNNYWYHGPTGTGKSRKAYLENPGAYRKACNKWWDHYRDQEVVIIEEMSPDFSCLAHLMKVWCDHYPFIAEMKGGSKMIRPKVFIVTSNYSLLEVFSGTENDPLRRRFKEMLFPLEEIA